MPRDVTKCGVLRPNARLRDIRKTSVWGGKKCLEATGGTGDKERAKTKFNTWLKLLDPFDIVIYTDGSEGTDKAGRPTGTGAGWVMHWFGSWHRKRGISLGETHEVYDVEAAALLGGLKEALNSALS